MSFVVYCDSITTFRVLCIRDALFGDCEVRLRWEKYASVNKAELVEVACDCLEFVKSHDDRKMRECRHTKTFERATPILLPK
jgi:hypothetical protein